MNYIDRVIKEVKSRNSGEPEFLQSVEEVFHSIQPVLEKHPEFEKSGILERIVEPERTISFRVAWVDDDSNVRVNRGYRTQFNSSIGPYKGGLRFHPSVYIGIIKFLGFEQTYKNALTGLPIGGGKGGSDFDPKGKSDGEIMRFCQSFMTELYRHIGPNVDVPAGNICVCAREIGYLYGQFKRIKNQFQPAVLTGKGLNYGGSLVRKEATGYGLIYFMKEMLNHHDLTLENKTVVISGSGNVAIYAYEKAKQFGAKIIAMSDSKGYIIDNEGVDLDTIKQLKEVERKRISEYVNYHPHAEYHENQQGLWSVKCDIALPCAAENDINIDSAKQIVKNGTLAVGEGANMPCTNAAVNYFLENNVLLAPAKAANAGGVATSALEMSQNSMRLHWSFEEVNRRLNEIMVNIFEISKEAAKEYNMEGNYVAGANIAGFLRVANAMSDQGII